MSTTREREILRLGQAALERPMASRAAFLAEACGGDETLRREVESLLAQESVSGAGMVGRWWDGRGVSRT